MQSEPIFGELESQPNTSPVVSDANASSVVGVVSIMAPVGSLTVTVPEETLEAPAPIFSACEAQQQRLKQAVHVGANRSSWKLGGSDAHGSRSSSRILALCSFSWFLVIPGLLVASAVGWSGK